MKIKPLPYKYDALEPYFSRRLVEDHFRNYRAHVKHLNILISKTIFENADIPTLIRVAKGEILFHAIQVQNHEFFFETLKPGTQIPEYCTLLNAIKGCFGSLQFFKDTFVKYVVSAQMGWIWLVINHEASLEIVKNRNIRHALRPSFIPLLVCDMCDHAYKLDFHNDRKAYAESFLNLINWELAAQRYATTMEQIASKSISIGF